MTRAQLSIIEEELQQVEDLERLAIVTELPNVPRKQPAFADYARTPMPLDPDLPIPENDVFPEVNVDIDMDIDAPVELDVDIDVPAEIDVPVDVPHKDPAPGRR